MSALAPKACLVYGAGRDRVRCPLFLWPPVIALNSADTDKIVTVPNFLTFLFCNSMAFHDLLRRQLAAVNCVAPIVDCIRKMRVEGLADNVVKARLNRGPL
jgi:hypothetical protein